MSKCAGTIIKLIREHRGLNAKTLAKRAGIDPSYLSRIEHDRIFPRIDKFEDICVCLGVPHWKVLMAGELYSKRILPIWADIMKELKAAKK